MSNKTGTLEIIAGPMFSGKTEELIKRVKRAEIARKRIIVIKHILDDRYRKHLIYSHSKQSFRSKIVKNAQEILKIIPRNTDVVAIDEAMWFGRKLIPVINRLVKNGKRVIVSGLSVTFDRKPFEPTPSLMAIADRVDKLNSVCTRCGKEAVFHKKIGENKINSLTITDKHVGKNDIYVACCRSCFDEY